MDASTPEKPDDADHKGPPLLLLAIVSTTLFVASIATTAIMTGGGHLPSPYGAGAARDSTEFFPPTPTR